MKIGKLIIIFLTSVILFANNAFSKCDFDANLGDKISDVEKAHGSAFELSEITSYIELNTEDVCKNEKLGDSFIQFRFLEGELASISIIIENGNDNEESQKLLLYKYVEDNYGSISDDLAQHWTGFKDWEKNGKIIVYKRIPFNFIIEEELFISNEEYIEKINFFHDEGEL